jgi:hypothetical protein
MFVSSTIHSIVTNYNDNTGETTIEVKTVGLYDHMGIKINNEDDDAYRVLWTNGTNVLHIGGVDPSNDIIIATLFDKDNRKLYTLIQQPIPNTDGSYTVHYAIIDSNNIAINDVLLPVIVLNGNAEIEIIQGSAYVEEGATVTHNSGEYIVPVITGMVDVNAVGTYTVTYTATDSNGNTSAIHRIVHVKTLEPIIRRFVGSSSFGAYPNYINLADNTEGLTFLENNLDVTNYLQGSNFELTFACKFNANTWINGGKLIEICNGFQADVALYIKTQSDGSIGVGYFSGVYGSFGGFPLSTLTNYYLLFTYSKTTTRFTLTISERLDGTSPKYEYNDYLSNPPPYVPVTDGTRSKWLVGSTHSQRTWEYFDGSITDITISNKILTWEEVF